MIIEIEGLALCCLANIHNLLTFSLSMVRSLLVVYC